VVIFDIAVVIVIAGMLFEPFIRLEWLILLSKPTCSMDSQGAALSSAKTGELSTCPIAVS
jgi:hypothetical protein